MTWINNQHINQPAPIGTFGGAVCLCPECEKKRKEACETRPDMDVWPELVEK